MMKDEKNFPINPLSEWKNNLTMVMVCFMVLGFITLASFAWFPEFMIDINPYTILIFGPMPICIFLYVDACNGYNYCINRALGSYWHHMFYLVLVWLGMYGVLFLSFTSWWAVITGSLIWALYDLSDGGFIESIIDQFSSDGKSLKWRSPVQFIAMTAYVLVLQVLIKFIIDAVVLQ